MRPLVYAETPHGWQYAELPSEHVYFIKGLRDFRRRKACCQHIVRRRAYILCAISTRYVNNCAEVTSANYLWTSDFLVDQAANLLFETIAYNHQRWREEN
jgi:hypothetical protein